jgi:hypothetical protein
MANVKVFADRQTDKQTDGQAKNYMPPIYRYGGIKKTSDVPVKDKNGKVVEGEAEKLLHWMEHFKSVLNRPDPLN